MRKAKHNTNRKCRQTKENLQNSSNRSRNGALVNDNLTESVDELLSGPHAEKWKEAMKIEYDGLIKNDVWELVKCPANRSPIG